MCIGFPIDDSQVGVSHMDSTFDLFVHGDPAVKYVIATAVIEVRALWCCCMEIASYDHLS